MMQRVEVVVDGVPVETWVASEGEAVELAEKVLSAAEAGSTVRVEVMTANGAELIAAGTLVLRLGSARSIAVRTLPDDRTGSAMGISR
jgi:hypothetical protein